jgi:PPM family protein phosphatase
LIEKNDLFACPQFYSILFETILFEMESGDALILCSDGLSNYIPPEEILQILCGTKNLKAATTYMITLANARGGDDNITVVLS